MGRTAALTGIAAVAATVAAIAAVSSLAATSAGSVRVTSSQNDGAGSFRAAIAQANADSSIGRIEFRHGLAPIALAQPVVYTGGQALDIHGNGAVLDGSGLAAADADAFLANGGGNLTVTTLAVRNAPQHGLTYDVPSGSTGTKKVVLAGVRIVGNGGHGVLVNDQDFPEEAGDPDAMPPISPNPAGSAASLEVWVVGSHFDGNGRAALDRDGLRVNEGGAGSLNAVISLTRVARSGGDGVELDERGDGDAVFNLSGTQITENGDFDLATDPDDGMDVDESAAGAVIGRILASAASDNFEEGWDLNENDAGDFRVDMTVVDASRNREEGIDFEEDDDFAGGGNLVSTLIGIKADGNAGGDAGLKIREKGEGSLQATAHAAQANDNATGGIHVREDAAGGLTSTIARATTLRNGSHGIDFDENGAGDLAAEAGPGNSSDNDGAGVRADEASDGVGNVHLTAMTLVGNGGGATAGNATFTLTP